MKTTILIAISFLLLTSVAYADRTLGELIKDAQDNSNYQTRSIDDKISYLQKQLAEEMDKVNDLKSQIRDWKDQKKAVKAELKARIQKIKDDGAPR